MRFRRWLIVTLGVVVAGLLAVPSVGAQTKTLRWHRWDADITINSDGTFHVRETYEIEFIGGEFTFGYRNIPSDQFEELVGVGVSEGGTAYAENWSEQANTFYSTRDGSEYVINWFYPPTMDASRVFTVEYTVVGGLIISEEVGDRFFWKAVGPEHAFPIESSTVVVTLPPGARVDTAIEPAIFGAEGTYEIAADGTRVTYRSDYVPANQEFEVGVRFPHGFVPNVKPAWQQEYEREQTWNDTGRPIANLAAGGLGMLLLVGGLLGVYTLWATAGRDPNIGPVPEYLAEIPSSLRPGLVGTLVDEKADLQDIIATLVDLARRGAIEMQEIENKVFGLTFSKGFVFRRKPDFSEALLEYEQTLVREVFGGRDEIELEDLKNKFYTAIPKIQGQLYKQAVAEGLFPRSPQGVRGRWLGLGIAGLVISVGAGMCVAGWLSDRVEAILCPFAALGVVSLAAALVGQAMPVKTRKGAEEAAKWRAFRTYLQNAERYADLTERTSEFDAYLPYSVAFGLERAWVNKFARIPGTPIPGWYFPAHLPAGHGDTGGAGRRRAVPGGVPEGGSMRDLRGEAVRPGPSLDGLSEGMFGSLSSMSDGLFSMLNSASSVFRSVPSSSGSGGGFSGGGFSGGGGGGGGGAGFG